MKRLGFLKPTCLYQRESQWILSGKTQKVLTKIKPESYCLIKE